MTEAVQVQDKGHVRTIALNRPEKMNALTHELAWAIVGEVQKAAHDDEVWVIALTGRGKRAARSSRSGRPSSGGAEP